MTTDELRSFTEECRHIMQGKPANIIMASGVSLAALLGGSASSVAYHPGTADDPKAACHPFCGPAPMDGWFLSKECVGGPVTDPLTTEREMRNNGTLAWSRHFTAADGTVVSVIIADSEGRVFHYWNGCQPR